MTLDQDVLVRLVHDQVETLLFKKEYEKVAQRRDPEDPGAKPVVGMSTVEFLSHFRMLQEMCHKWKPIEIPDMHVPVLVVVPFSLVGVKEQLEKAGIGHAWGDDPEVGEVRDHEKETFPKDPYVLIDIKMEAFGHSFSLDGLERIWIDRSARGWYKDRIMLTLSEGIALATHFPRRINKQHSYELAGSFHRPPFDLENCSLEEIEKLATADVESTYWQPRDQRMYFSRLNDGRLWLSFFNYQSSIEASWAFPLGAIRADPYKY